MTQEMHSVHQSGFLRLPAVLKLIPVSKSSWWQGVKDGIYPQPYKIGQRVTAWKAEDIQNLIQQISSKR